MREITIGMLALSIVASSGVAWDAHGEGVDAYRQRVAAAVWQAAREIRVRNPAVVADTVAVIVQVQDPSGTTFAVADEAGLALVAQVDDLDGNGAADEVCFLLTLEAGAERVVTLLSGPADVSPLPPDLETGEHRAGSWEPVRMQPTRSMGTTQHSTYISPTNRERARRLMERLDKAVPMERVRCDDFRLLLGHASGLIEGMRPGGIPRDYLGSFLREFVPGRTDEGAMRRRFAGPVRCGFEWLATGRRVTVYRNGTIETTWDNAPALVQIIACAYPYRYLQSGPGDVVRYSTMPEMKRALPGVRRVALYGKGDASLRIEARGLEADRHEVWLDAGNVAWEVALDNRDKKTSEAPAARMGRLLADTCVAGGMHVLSWRGAGGEGSLTYRIANHGETAWSAGTGLARVGAPGATVPVPKLITPGPQPAVALELERTDITVNRLHPNRINGWELRPVTLARHNPQPAYFAATLVNRSDREVTIELSLDAADWVLEASVLHGRETLNHDQFEHPVVNYQHEEQLVPGRGSVRLAVPARESLPLDVVVRPKENTLGRLRGTLRWSGAGGGSADLTVCVRPTIMFMPMYVPCTDLGREYGNVAWRGAPLMYDYRFWGGTTPARRAWRIAARRDAEREGFWVMELMYLKPQLDEWKTHGSERCREWTAKMLDVVRDPEYAKYRVRVNLHDEIWEAIGGYKGRVLVGEDVVAALDRTLLTNSPNAVWPSFQEPGIEKPFQYHLKLPNDIAEVFYYCGRDERLQEFARKLVEPRRTLFEQWKADPAFRQRAGTDAPRALHSFWISSQLHVTRYESIRRQCWWLRHHGIDSLLCWAHAGGGYKPYANRILNLMVLPVAVPAGRGVLLTDRALAWMDMKEDMDLVTLVRLLSEDVNDPDALAELAVSAARALTASQNDAFEEARRYYGSALRKMRPDLAYLAPRDVGLTAVEAQPLPDFLAAEGVPAAMKNPTLALPILRAGAGRPNPSVDGVLDNAYLEQGVTLDLREALTGGRPRAATSVYVVRDEEHLYILYSCNEPQMDRLRMNVTERDNAVYLDDCVELFVDRARDGEHLLHIAVNAGGARYDSAAGLGSTWNPDYEVATRRGDESWTVEMMIPFAALGGPPQPGERWRVNFCRERYATPELSAWSATFGGFHSPERFGVFTFK